MIFRAPTIWSSVHRAPVAQPLPAGFVLRSLVVPSGTGDFTASVSGCRSFSGSYGILSNRLTLIASGPL